MFDMTQVACALAGFILGWVAHTKFGGSLKLKASQESTPSSDSVSLVPVNPEPKDPYDAILEMVAAENRKKEKLSQILDALNPTPEKKG